MKNALTILILMAALFSFGADEYRTATVTVTNSSTTADYLGINSLLRRGTNARSSTTWLTNGSPMWTTTNILSQLGRFPIAGIIVTNSASNVFKLKGINLTLSNSAFAAVTWATQSLGSNQWAVMLPMDDFPLGVRQTNSSLLVYALSAYATNSFAETSAALGKFVSTNQVQTIANKTLLNSRLSGGTNDGTRVTNSPFVHASNLVAQTLSPNGEVTTNLGSILRGTIEGAKITNSTHVDATNITAQLARLISLSASSGTISNLSAPGAGLDSLRIGSAAIASGDYTIAIGNGASATNTDSIAFGRASASYGVGSFSLGNGSYAEGYGAFAFGSGAESIGIASGAIGTGASSSYSNAIAIGAFSYTDTTNQIAIGTPEQKITLRGRVESATLTNTTLRGQVDVEADVAFVPLSNTSMANGFNSGINLGSNTWVKLSGHSAAITNVGFLATRNGSERIVQVDNPGLSAVIRHDSGLEATAANRIYTGTGAEVRSTNNPAMFRLIYDGAVGRWRLISAW